jgi:hypothetical protein
LNHIHFLVQLKKRLKAKGVPAANYRRKEVNQFGEIGPQNQSHGWFKATGEHPHSGILALCLESNTMESSVGHIIIATHQLQLPTMDLSPAQSCKHIISEKPLVSCLVI